MVKNIAYIVARLLAALIMLQTLYFKFSGHPESMYIFEKCGLEPHGRWTVGVFELIASVLLIIPRTAWLGGLLGVGLMAGAMFVHLTDLGIEVMEDGGTLFGMAVLVFICSLFVIFVNKDKIFSEIIPRILKRK